jgi:hypothetical protein
MAVRVTGADGQEKIIKERKEIMTNENEIVLIESAGFLSPAVSVRDALLAYQAKKDLIDGIMKPDVDYGIIPGTSKNTLLKAGAEKATSFFGLSARFKDAEIIEDFTGKDHDGEAFFFYRRTCELWKGNYIVAAVDGSCNSFEKKYRYRNSERICPMCGKSAIIRGKEEYGGGWLCYAKKGGCGAKFADNDPAIINQETGQVKNPDIADLANTILKMADKRALVAATLIATGLSEYFTQDIEDFVTGEFVEITKPTKVSDKVEPMVVESTLPAPLPNTADELKKIFALEYNAALKVVKKGTKLPSIEPQFLPKQIKEAIAGVRAAVAAAS